uniref:Uncharacterized protein n=1 Tax=Arundo donax TaxID=35708 RepID=A0A0A9BV13_ARUDO
MQNYRSQAFLHVAKSILIYTETSKTMSILVSIISFDELDDVWRLEKHCIAMHYKLLTSQLVDLASLGFLHGR